MIRKRNFEKRLSETRKHANEIEQVLKKKGKRK